MTSLKRGSLRRYVEIFLPAAAVLFIGFDAHANYDKLVDALEESGALRSEQAISLKQGAAKPNSVSPSSSAIKDLQIRGRIQSQFGFVQAENDSHQETFNTLELRRVRLGLRGTLLNDVRAQLEAHMVPGSNFTMRSAFLQWRKHKYAYLKAGYDKPHSSLEENTSSGSILTVERSLINSMVAAPGPLNGLSLDGGVGMLSYGIGTYTDTANRNTGGEEPKYLHNLHLGLALDDLLGDNKLKIQASYLNSDDPAGKVGEAMDSATTLAIHFVQQAFDLRVEYFFAETGENDISGWYAMLSYYLSEANQVVFRFEQASSEDGMRVPSRYTREVPQITAAQVGDDYQASYLGWNHYFDDHAHKVMAGIEVATMKNTTTGDLNSTSVYAAWRMLF